MDDRPHNLLARNRAKAGAAEIFDVLREEIVSLRLSPGAPLQRAELQRRFGLSSTPLRDALMRLQEERLVEVFPQHATMVSLIDLAAAERAQFLRKSVEIEVVRLLAQDPARAPVDRLRSLIRQQTTFADLGEHEAFTTADGQFHRTMFEAAGVSDLWLLVRRESGHIDRLRRLNLPVEGKSREIILAHAAITEAIAAGIPDAAQAAMREHLSRSLLFAPALRERHPAYFRA